MIPYILTVISESMIVALILTLVVEFFVILCFRIKIKHFYVVFLLLNIVTNLSMNIVLQHTTVANDNWIVFGMEVVVILEEGIVYFWILKDFKKAFFISLVANTASYGIGMLLMPYLF